MRERKDSFQPFYERVSRGDAKWVAGKKLALAVGFALMIVGLGIDLVEIARIRRAMENPRFVYRILTDAERALCTTPERVAGRWAAKEAVLKATGLPLKWHDIEILNDHFGAPQAHIRSLQWDGKRLRLNVSITHERSNAAAVAVLERVVLQVPNP